MNRPTLLFMFLSAFLVFESGCNRTPIPGLVPARGTVLYDGKPIDGVSIVFTPQSGSPSDRFATAVSNEQGFFELNTVGFAGALPGAYQVTLSKQTIIPALSMEEELQRSEAGLAIPEAEIVRHIPWIYERPDTSNIVAEIDKKGKTDLLIELMPDDTPMPKRPKI